MNLLDFVKKNLLIFLVLVFFAIWYFSNINGSLLADEVFYSKLSTAMLEGNFLGESSVRPLMQYFFSLSQVIFGQTDFAMRFFSPIFSVFALLLAYKISFELSQSKTISAITAIFVGAIPIYAQYSVRAMFDIPLTFFALFLFYLALLILKKPTIELYFVAGVISAFAMATKTYGIFFAFAFIAVLPINWKLKAKKLAEIAKFFRENSTIFLKYFFIFFVPSLFVAFFVRSQLLFNWFNVYSEANRQHAMAKLPAIISQLLIKIDSMHVFLLIALASFAVLFVLWLMLSFFISKIFNNPQKTMLWEFAIFLLISVFLAASQAFSIPVFALIGFALFPLLNIAIILFFQKNTEPEDSFLSFFGMGFILSLAVLYLPFLAKFVDTISRFFYSNFVYLKQPLTAYVFGIPVNPSPFWAYEYWFYIYGGIAFSIAAVFALAFFAKSAFFGKKIFPENLSRLFLFTAIVLILLSLLSMKFPRYLLSIMPLIAIFSICTTFMLSTALFQKINSAEKFGALSVLAVLAIILLPGIIFPFPLEKPGELLQNLPGEGKNFPQKTVPHYIAEWGISNTVTSPIIVSLQNPDIHIDSGMNEASQIIKKYALSNPDKNVIVVAWNPYQSLEFYIGKVPQNLQVIDRVYLADPAFFEKLKNGGIPVAVLIPADPERFALKQQLDWIEKNFKIKQSTSGYAIVYFFR